MFPTNIFLALSLNCISNKNLRSEKHEWSLSDQMNKLILVPTNASPSSADTIIMSKSFAVKVEF